MLYKAFSIQETFIWTNTKNIKDKPVEFFKRKYLK